MKINITRGQANNKILNILIKIFYVIFAMMLFLGFCFIAIPLGVVVIIKSLLDDTFHFGGA